MPDPTPQPSIPLPPSDPPTAVSTAAPDPRDDLADRILALQPAELKLLAEVLWRRGIKMDYHPKAP